MRDARCERCMRTSLGHTAYLIPIPRVELIQKVSTNKQVRIPINDKQYTSLGRHVRGSSSSLRKTAGNIPIKQYIYRQYWNPYGFKP
jgi:hypothetical protein